MPVAIYLGKRAPLTKPFLFLVVDPAEPDGFRWTTHHSDGTWFDTMADGRAFIAATPRLPSNVVLWYFKRGNQYP